MIKIINYGVGNIDAFISIYRNLGIDIGIASKPDDLAGASKLILPGVGHFDYAMLKFKQTGMLNSVNNLVLNKRIPVLGICVGMQIMAHSSEEGFEKGLSWIDAILNEESYKDFYRELYPMQFEEPLFNIHLNVDYPFNLTGILYFPKISNDINVQKDKIQLYQNQVFVTDNVEGIVPEFFNSLKRSY